MIKKISALVLALVLCLSVVVMPVNAAAELGSNKVVISLEWDKANYSAGDTAVLNVYMAAADDVAIGAASIAIGLNSAVINQTDNPIADVKANATVCDLFASYFKDPVANISWLATTVANNINNVNTEAEKALYNHYIKLNLSKNASGTHPNAGNNMDGLYGSEIDPATPIYTLKFKIAANVADGTVVKAGIASGSLVKPTANNPATYVKSYSTPGSATTQVNVVTSTSVEKAETPDDVVIGAATIVNPLKGQMRYGKEAGTYDVRALAVISGADFTATFGSVDAAKTKIKDIGFVFASGSNISAPSMDAVAALVEKGTAIEGYKKVPISQISTAISTGNYVFSCIVTDIPAAAAQTDKLIAVGYVAWDSDADGVVDSYNYYTEAQTINFADYYKA